MMKSIAGILAIVAGAILGACAGTGDVAQDKGSGFLRDTSKMTETKDSAGMTIRSWVSPKLTPANYNAILLDPLVFYPEPRPTERVTAEELQQILAYSNSTLKQSMSKRFNVVDRAGPGVVRIRAAFSSVGAEGEGLKAYQYIPIAFLVTAASRAAEGGAPQRAFIAVEAEATDSVTGELLAERMRVGTGARLAKFGEKDTLTLERVKPLLDEMAAAAMPELGKFVKGK